MSESEMQKILEIVARECHLQRSRMVKRGIKYARTRRGNMIAYEVRNIGHHTEYVKLGRVENENATV